ncbi:MAG: response regulator [Candidatus Spechtbacteria bacterium]|nr:response regulator [Candidatus Spechtbacteria bacterium]
MAKKILFIEDDTTLQESLGQVLKGAGFEVFRALNGEDGLKLAGEENPDVILLDLILPKINGFDVLKELKGSDSTKHIPVIVLTNLESPEDIQKALFAGASTYLLKASYELEDVLAKVKKALQAPEA